jgi:hypothetical protein
MSKFKVTAADDGAKIRIFFDEKIPPQQTEGDLFSLKIGLITSWRLEMNEGINMHSNRNLSDPYITRLSITYSDLNVENIKKIKQFLKSNNIEIQDTKEIDTSLTKDSPISTLPSTTLHASHSSPLLRSLTRGRRDENT